MSPARPPPIPHDLHDLALAIALEAGAIERCYDHATAWIEVGGPEGERRAYALGAEKVADRQVRWGARRLEEAIRAVFRRAAQECPTCEEIAKERA